MSIAVATLSQPEVKVPKQVKLLGATVQGVGTITSVSAILFDCFALIEDETGREHHRFVADLSKDEVTFPDEPQPYHTYNRRVGYGLFETMHNLETRNQATDLKAACLECGGLAVMDKKPAAKKCLTVEVENLDPFATVALFKYAQNVCKRNGLTELVEVRCNIVVTFSGAEDVSLEEAKAALAKWQDATVTETEVTR